MRAKKSLSLGMVSAVVAGVLAVSVAPVTQVGPAQATGGEGWSALGTGMGGIAPAWPGKRVFQIVRTPDGMVYAGGNFTSAGGDTSAANFARYNPTTSAWTPVGGAVTGPVYAVAYDSDASTGHVWIGGGVTNVSGSAVAGRVARWSVSTSAWVPTTGVGSGDDGVEEIVVVAPNEVYIGGFFGSGTVGTTADDGFVMFDGTSPVTVGGGLGTARIVNGMAADGLGGVILSGQFTSVGGASANRVAQWNGSAYSTFGGANFGPASGVVAAVASTSAGAIIGGNFLSVRNNSTAVANTKALARWNDARGEWESIGAVVGTVVEELRVIGDYLYVGGEFNAVGGVTATNIARYKLSTATWEAVTHGCTNGVNGVVRSIVDTGLGDGSIYVGGGFTEAGGVAGANGIAKYVPSTLGCSSGGGSGVLTPPTNFRLAGLVRDRVDGLAGMRAHLAWDVPAGGGGASFFVVTTKGLQGAGGLDESVEHPDLTCVTSEATCSIFFPFTSQVPSMRGRQYHQVIYSMQAYGLFGQSTPVSVGPLTQPNGTTASAPQNVQTSAKWNSITVTWDEPASFGSAGFATNYLVTSQPGRRVCIVSIETFPAPASTRQCTFNNLRSRIDYTFTVQALTFDGWGAASAPTGPVAQLDLDVTSSLRTRPFFSFPGTSRIRVSGVASGYAAGTPVRTFMQIGTAAWREVRNANVRVDGSGRILFTQTISPLYARRTVGVRFEIDTTGRCGEPFASAGTCGKANSEVMRRVW